MLLHDGQVNAVASGEAAVSQDNLFGTFGNCPVNGKHFIHNIQKGIKSKLNVMMPIDGRIPMQNLLQDLGVRNQALTLAHELFQQPLGISLVGTGCTRPDTW